MKLTTLLQLSLMCFVSISMHAQTFNPQEVRNEVVINREWTFNYFPSGKEDTTTIHDNYNDQQWMAIALPHTWSTYETTNDIHPYIMYASEREDPYWWNGWGGYYRKRIVLGKELEGKKDFYRI